MWSNINITRSAFFLGLLFVAGSLFISCAKKDKSSKYDFSNIDSTSTAQDSTLSPKERRKKKKGQGLSKVDGIPKIPNMVYIEGGKATIPVLESDPFQDNYLDRTVMMESFFMDETEIANIHWLEYLYYLQKDSTEDYYRDALPDTTVWRSKMAFNDPIADHYFRYPGFSFYPVVGVSWLQVTEYCEWRTVMVNRVLQEKSGVDLTDSLMADSALEVLIPTFRLPSEEEWEYAAQAIVAPQFQGEQATYRRTYPWDGHTLRNPYGKYQGQFMANFKRGRGDYGGLGKTKNDGAFYTAYIYNYPPNDFGLYNMAGNVNEWVYDEYQPKGFGYIDKLNPDRLTDEEGAYDPESRDEGFQTIFDHSVRVYKGGSWSDHAFWLMPGRRRWIQEDSSTCTIGFRCAMDLQMKEEEAGP